MTGPRKSSATLAIVTLFALAIAATSCVAGDPQFTAETPAGFWLGLWHGAISFVTLVVGIFSDGVRMYEPHNSGGWYDLGFFLGATSIWGAGSHRASRMRRSPPRSC